MFIIERFVKKVWFSLVCIFKIFSIIIFIIIHVLSLAFRCNEKPWMRQRSHLVAHIIIKYQILMEILVGKLNINRCVLEFFSQSNYTNSIPSKHSMFAHDHVKLAIINKSSLRLHANDLIRMRLYHLFLWQHLLRLFIFEFFILWLFMVKPEYIRLIFIFNRLFVWSLRSRLFFLFFFFFCH